MTIKKIFDEIANESSTNEKMNILKKYKDDELLKRVLYLANSKRVKYYIKQIPKYEATPVFRILSLALDQLNVLSDREKTGNDAIEHLIDVLSHLSKEDAYIVERIIEKDCKIGMGTRMLNKVWLELIEKTGYMGCKPYSKDLLKKILSKGKAFSQKKMDGRFVNIIVRGGEVEMESRQGEPTILDNPKFLNELKQLKDCVLNAELTMDNVSRYESNGIIASLISIANKINDGEDVNKEISKFEEKHMEYRKALNSIRVTAWDTLTPDEYYDRSSATPYNKRFDNVINTVKGFDMLSVVESKMVSTLEEAIKHFEEIIRKGDEGTVLKSLDGAWKDGKPSYQVKLKKEVNLDLKIVGFNYGTGKNAELISSVNVESADGLLKTSPTGITEEKMIEITENQDELLNTILEIKCSGISQDSEGNYSVLHPVYKLERTDKKKANTLAECIEIDKSSSLL